MTLDATQMPQDWRIAQLGDVAEVAFSSVDKKTVDGEVPVELCNYTDVFYNPRIVPEMPFMAATASPAECERWTLRQGDVLFTKDSETPDEIGIPAYIPENLPGVLCGYHLGRARPASDSVSGAFLARALGSRASARAFARIANGVTRFGLTLEATRPLPILLPPLPEQRAIAAVLDGIDEAIERTEEVIAATERLRDALLRELLTRGLPGRHSEWVDVPGLGTVPACWDVVRLGDAEPYGLATIWRPFSGAYDRTGPGQLAVPGVALFVFVGVALGYMPTVGSGDAAGGRAAPLALPGEVVVRPAGTPLRGREPGTLPAHRAPCLDSDPGAPPPPPPPPRAPGSYTTTRRPRH